MPKRPFRKKASRLQHRRGYSTEEDEAQDLPISMVHLGWVNVELKSEDWVKIMDQPSVRVMKVVMDDDKDRKKTKVKNFVNEDDGKGSSVKTYCVTDLEMSKQQELVEASFQMRCRIFEFNAVLCGHSSRVDTLGGRLCGSLVQSRSA